MVFWELKAETKIGHFRDKAKNLAFSVLILRTIQKAFSGLSKEDGGDGLEIDGAYRTTTEHFERYKAEIERLCRLFQISGWSIKYSYSKMKTSQGRYTYSDTHRYILFEYNDGIAEDTPEEVAQHEFFEGLLIGRLKEMARNGKATEEEAEGEAHRIVHLLVAFMGRKEENDGEEILIEAREMDKCFGADCPYGIDNRDQYGNGEQDGDVSGLPDGDV